MLTHIRVDIIKVTLVQCPSLTPTADIVKQERKHGWAGWPLGTDAVGVVQAPADCFSLCIRPLVIADIAPLAISVDHDCSMVLVKFNCHLSCWKKSNRWKCDLDGVYPYFVIYSHPRWKSSKQAIQVCGVVTLLHASYTQAKESQTTLRNKECNSHLFIHSVILSSNKVR